MNSPFFELTDVVPRRAGRIASRIPVGKRRNGSPPKSGRDRAQLPGEPILPLSGSGLSKSAAGAVPAPAGPFPPPDSWKARKKPLRVSYVTDYYVEEALAGIASFARDARWTLDTNMRFHGMLPRATEADGIIATATQERVPFISSLSEQDTAISMQPGARVRSLGSSVDERDGSFNAARCFPQKIPC